MTCDEVVRLVDKKKMVNVKIVKKKNRVGGFVEGKI